MSVADRVRKLAALAGSDNEHEANAAAQHACRLIREGKVTISDPRAAPSQEPDDFFGWPMWMTEAPRPAPAPPPPPKPERRVPTGPFVRDHAVRGAPCVVCGEPVHSDDGFKCPEGHVHGDCIPRGRRP